MGALVTAADVLDLTVETLEATEGTVALALGGITVGGRAGGLSASLTVRLSGSEVRMGLTKLEGETEWVVDSQWLDGRCIYANGVGSRATALKVLLNAELVAALDEAAEGMS